jgi:glycosyltransferase EpsF
MNGVKPLRVLHVVGAMNRAGTETMLMNIFRNIDRNKIHFDFISYSQGEADYDSEIQQLGGRVIKLSKTQSIKEIIGVIKKYGPYDVVHSHTLFHCGIANLAAKLAGVKVRIAHAHTTLDDSNNLLRKLYMKTMRSLITTCSTHLLACSKQAGSYLFGEYSIKKTNYSFFPNLINYSQFIGDHADAVSKFKIEQDIENNLVIGHIGRFITSKNHTFLLDILQSTLKKYEKVKLVLVGDGELRKQIEEEAKKKGLLEHIRFVGIRDDIDTMLHSMDVFVFPSIYEGLGLVLLEAQASGVPCVVSEAIQPEADLNMNLVTKLKLKAHPDIWAENVLQLVKNKGQQTVNVPQAFDKSGYSFSAGISKLLYIYQA